MFRFVPAIFILLFFSSCSGKDKIPKSILPQGKIQDVMWDMILADEFVTSYIWKNDSLINRLEESSKFYERIFSIHKITKEQFQKSITYYREHPDLLTIIVDSLNAKESILRKRAPLKSYQDSISVKKNSLHIQ